MITIGITTYNRKKTLEMMARSFYNSNLSHEHRLLIYDDASDEYDEKYLRELFPDAESIHVQEHNLGSDENIRFMYEDFLNTGDEFFFNADSDLLFHKEWMNVLVGLIDYTDGVLSAFNSIGNHKPENEYSVNGITLVEKANIGSAGTMFRRAVVKEIIDGLGEYDSGSFDWKWSSLLNKKQKKIYTLKSSMVQHIGFTGFNTVVGSADYGFSFVVDSLENGQAINDTLEDVYSSRKSNPRKRISLFPFSEIEKGSRVVIYGAGTYGQDYCKQIKAINYCDIVALCDAQYMDMEGVTDPKQICDMEYDYVVVSVKRDDLVKEIKRFLTALGVPGERIIAGGRDRLIEVN